MRPKDQTANQRSVCGLDRRKRTQGIRGFANSGDSFRRGRFRRASGGPIFSALPEKMGEKRGAGRVWCVLRVQFRQEPVLYSLQTHELTLRALNYAPPVTVLQICESLRLNCCGKNALRSKSAIQYEFAGVPTPPLAAPRAGRGGGIFGENDGGDMLQISECSVICGVRIPSVSFADSFSCAQPLGRAAGFDKRARRAASAARQARL